jgi:hypothetical protein
MNEVLIQFLKTKIKGIENKKSTLSKVFFNINNINNINKSTNRWRPGLKLYQS